MAINIKAILQVAEVQGLNNLGEKLNKALNFSNFGKTATGIKSTTNSLLDMAEAINKLGGTSKQHVNTFANALQTAFPKSNINNIEQFIQKLGNLRTQLGKIDTSDFTNGLKQVRKEFLDLFGSSGISRSRAGKFFDSLVGTEVVNKVKESTKDINRALEQSAKESLAIEERGAKEADRVQAYYEARRKERRTKEISEQNKSKSIAERQSDRFDSSSANEIAQKAREDEKKRRLAERAARQQERDFQRENQRAALNAAKDAERLAKAAERQAAKDRAEEARAKRQRINQHAESAQQRFDQRDAANASRQKEIDNFNKALRQQALSIDRNRLSFDKFTRDSALAAKRLAAFLIPSTVFFTLAASIRRAASESLQFEKIITRIQQASDTSNSTVAKLSGTIQDLAAKTGTSGTQLAEGVEVFAQAGIKDVQKLQEIAKSLADVPLAATFGSIKDTSEGLLAVIGQFNVDVSESGRVLDLVNQFAKDFAVTSQDLFEGIKRGGSAFQVAGGSLEEFISLFSTLSEVTRESADTLGTFFKTGAAQLLSKRSQALVKDLGVNTKQSLVGQLKDLSEVVVGSGKFSGIQQINIAEGLVGGRQFNRLISLLRALQNPELKQRLEAALQNAPGSLAQSTEKSADDVNKSLARIQESFNNLGRTIIEDENLKRLVGVFANLTKSILGAAGALKGLITPLAAFGSGIALLGAGRFLGEFVPQLRGGVTRRQIAAHAEAARPILPNQSANEIQQTLQERANLQAALERSFRGQRSRFSPRRLLRTLSTTEGIGAGLSTGGFLANQVFGESPLGNSLVTGGAATALLGAFGRLAGVAGGLVIGFQTLNDTIRENNKNEQERLLGEKTSLGDITGTLIGGPASTTGFSFGNILERLNLRAKRSFGNLSEDDTRRLSLLENKGGTNVASAANSLIEKNILARNLSPVGRAKQNTETSKLLENVSKSSTGDLKEDFKKFRDAFFKANTDAVRTEVNNISGSNKFTQDQIEQITELTLQGIFDSVRKEIDQSSLKPKITPNLGRILDKVTSSFASTLTSFNKISIALDNTSDLFNDFESALNGINVNANGFRNIQGRVGAEQNIRAASTSALNTFGISGSDRDALLKRSDLAKSEASKAATLLGSSPDIRNILDKLFVNGIKSNQDNNEITLSLSEKINELLSSGFKGIDSLALRDEITKNSTLSSGIKDFFESIRDIAIEQSKSESEILDSVIKSTDLISTFKELRNVNLEPLNQALNKRIELLNKELDINNQFEQSIGELNDKIFNISLNIKNISRDIAARNLEQTLFKLSNQQLSPSQLFQAQLKARSTTVGGLPAGASGIPNGLQSQVIAARNNLNNLNLQVQNNPQSESLVKAQNQALNDFNNLMKLVNRTVDLTNQDLQDLDKVSELLKGNISDLTAEINKQIDASRQRGQTLLNTSPADLLKQRSVLNTFVSSARGSNITDAALKLSQDQLNVLQEILKTFGDRNLPGLATSGNQILNKLFESVDIRSIKFFNQNRNVSQEEIDNEKTRRSNIQNRIRELERIQKNFLPAIPGVGFLPGEKEERLGVKGELIALRRELRGTEGVPIQDFIRNQSLREQITNNTTNGPVSLEAQLAETLKKQADIASKQEQVSKDAIDLQKLQRDVLTLERDFYQSQQQSLPALLSAFESVSKVFGDSKFTSNLDGFSKSIGQFSEQVDRQVKGFDNIIEKIGSNFNSTTIVQSINPIYDSVQNIEKILSKLSTGYNSSTLEVKPISVNVVLDAPDILKLAGPQLYRSILDKLGPAIGSALGVVSPEAQSKFETDINRG